MLGNRSKKSKGATTKVDTLIGHETEISGDVHFGGGLHVDGVIKGNVHADGATESMAIISERGRIEGELRVPNLLINGYVAGDVYAAERLDLARNARVQGDVYYHTMEMAGGAEVNGKLVRTDQAHQRYLEHQQANGAAPGPASQADAEATGAEATGAEAGPEPATPGGEARRDS
jgi:cytoskeletal protein CcmA (bactofilin family)